MVRTGAAELYQLAAVVVDEVQNVQLAKMCLFGERRLYDSDKMIPYFEEKFPQKKLGRPDELPSVCVACPQLCVAFCFSALCC